MLNHDDGLMGMRSEVSLQRILEALGQSIVLGSGPRSQRLALVWLERARPGVSQELLPVVLGKSERGETAI